MVGDIDFIAAEDVEPKEIKNPKFSYPTAYIRQVVSAWQNGGILPKVGGFDDQDYHLMRDCLTWLACQNFYVYGAQLAYRRWLDEERERRKNAE
jgi:hypothetical protein